LSDFVYIPVPAKWATAVYKTIAELALDDVPAKDEQAAAITALDAALVERMYRESHAGHRRLMQFLADHPGEWFYTSEIASALDHENGARGVAGMLGAFQKRSNHRYGGLKPWESDWDDTREESRHRIEPEHATVINAIGAAAAR
jgi:hypothetical protein